MMPNNLTREDMLRELELLPAWQLRTPLPEMVMNVGRVLTRQDVELKPYLQVESVAETVENPTQIAVSEAVKPPTFTHIASENGEYLFVLPSAAMSADESQLFQNICKSMRINVKAATLVENTVENLHASRSKLVIVMGNNVAQATLQSVEEVALLRGKLHVLFDMQLVVTYGLDHLLNNGLDKAKVWDDLCLAMQTLLKI